MFPVRIFAAQSSSGEVPEMSLLKQEHEQPNSQRSWKRGDDEIHQGTLGHTGLSPHLSPPWEQQVEGPSPNPLPQGMPGWQLWWHGQVTHCPLYKAVKGDSAVVAWGKDD